MICRIPFSLSTMWVPGCQDGWQALSPHVLSRQLQLHGLVFAVLAHPPLGPHPLTFMTRATGLQCTPEPVQPLLTPHTNWQAKPKFKLSLNSGFL